MAWASWLKRLPLRAKINYTYHDRGFALLSMRTPQISRLYLQCKPDEDINLWDDERIWQELQTRLASEGWKSPKGQFFRKA